MTAFALSTQAFSGPLHALLTLIEERKLPVSEVSLSGVCDAYLAYVESLTELPLGETAQFVLVASTLLLIKSRTLLPTLELSKEEEQSIEELERRLARYARIRATAKALRSVWGVQPLFFARRAPAVAFLGFSPRVFSPGETTMFGIHTALQKLVSLLPKVEHFGEARVAPLVALEEVILSLKKRIAQEARTRWSEITKSASRHDLIVHFLAVLELVRNGSVSATQDKLFSDILLETETVGTPRFTV